MKKICFLTDSLFTIGGVQRVTAVVAQALAADYAVTVVTFDRRASADLSLYGLGSSAVAYRFFSYPRAGRLKTLVSKTYSALYRKLRLPWRWASQLYGRSSFPSELRMALAHELRQGGYDVIVGVHAPLAVRLATCRPLLGGARLVGWIHNSFDALYGSGSRYVGPELRRHYMYQLEQLDATVVLSRADARRYPFATRVIYNPLTLRPCAPSSGQSHRFLAVGRFTPLHKGFDLLIEAFALFAQEERQWQLDIVGEGPEEPLYRQMIARAGLQQRIHLHPFTHDIQRHYTGAQVFVLASRWEGMPLVLVEAMSHGLPVVASDLPVCREVMADAALYFPVGDSVRLARCLHEATRFDWPARSAAALSTARRFDLRHCVEQWHGVIEGRADGEAYVSASAVKA